MSLIFNFSENPMEDYIPNIFRDSMMEEILYLFYSELSLYIDNLDKFGKEEIFYKWIKDFLDRRSEGYPISISNQEKNLIIRFLVKFTNDNIDLDNILSRFDKEFFIEQSTLWFFTYCIEITKDNVDIINKIMIFVTDQMINNTQDLITNTTKLYLKDIFNKVSKIGANTDKFEKNLEFMNVN